MIKITLNGQDITINPGTTLAALLQQNGYANKKIAATRGGSFVPKSSYETTVLMDGDAVEILAPMQGG